MILDGDVRDEVTCSSLLFFPSLLPLDLCMKYLLCLVIYKKNFVSVGSSKNFGFSPVPTAMNRLFFFPPNYENSRQRLQIWNLKFWGSILMTEMESPLENYADGLRFHFDGYEICRLLYRRVGDALSSSIQATTSNDEGKWLELFS